MSSLDFIIDNIRFSYSSLTTYETCPYSFKLTYIDKLQRESNFYGEYGTLVHNAMEQYFSDELEAFELSQYFMDNYPNVVKSMPPAYPAGMEERYLEAGLLFFDNFYFDKQNYEVILNEEIIEFDYNDEIKFTARPDLILKEKATGKNILFDYKTSAPFRVDKRSGKEIVDKKKIEGYHKQMFIYAYALREHRGIPINEITLWYTRPDRKYPMPWTKGQETSAMAWLKRTIKKIRKDEEFIYNNTSGYFCDNLCSVREYCEYR